MRLARRRGSWDAAIRLEFDEHVVLSLWKEVTRPDWRSGDVLMTSGSTKSSKSPFPDFPDAMSRLRG